MSIITSSLFIGTIRCDTTPYPVGKLRPVWIPSMSRRFAMSTDTAEISPEKRNVPIVKRDKEERRGGGEVAEKEKHNWEKGEEKRSVLSGWKEYLEEAKVIVGEGGAPRWFSPPLDGGSRMENTPLLLYLPGIDGLGLGLTLHHQKLGRIFDVSCFHIPVADRTPFPDLVKIVESRIRSENQRSPNKPIYLVGESLGACLALTVAARNPDIDLVLILANPATSFSGSRLQQIMSLLEALPGSLSSSLPDIVNLMPGDSLRMVMGNLLNDLPLQNSARELMEDFISLSSSLPVIADVLPKETLLWRLKMLKSASAIANSRIYAIKAQTLILCSEKDQLLPSKEECERLHQILPNCDLRKFEDSGHFLFLEGKVDLVTVIKGTSFYRRGKVHDYASDFIPPTPAEAKKLIESFSLFNTVTNAVMLSTMEDGTIVKGLAGIPSEGPVLFVGYHMLMGCDLVPLVSRFFMERNILVRGIAHPIMFHDKKGKGSIMVMDRSFYDTVRIMGAAPVAASTLFKLLSSKSHVLLYPGGAREAIHRKGEEYKLFWPERSEFVRMAARFGAKIVPFGAVGEDDLGQVVADYDDLVKIPFFKSEMEKISSEVITLRNGADGEVANQPLYVPGILPKVPGRFYYYFGKPIETEGKKQVLKYREKSHELYLEVKSEVQKCLDYLMEKRESDPYRSIVPRLLYQATHGLAAEVPTFEI